MIIITGSVVVRPEHREQALALGIEHSARSRGEPGCIAHSCHTDAENPDRVVFVEQWADMAAVAVHFAVPECWSFVAALSGLADGAPEMTVWSAEKVQ